MEQKRQVITVGTCAVVLALVLRLISVAPLQNETFLSFLVYLQTGRLVRYWEISPPTTPSSPPPTPGDSKPQPFPGLQFAPGDEENVQIYDFTATNPAILPLLQQPLNWVLTGDEPTVLILHTHATESYTQQSGEIYEESSAYRTLNSAYNMLSVGEELARVLEAGGISVLHDRTLHDYPSYSGSYDHARRTINAYLEAFPSIQMVIDLHRDALDLGAETQLTTSATVGSEKSVQLMLVAGSDRNASHPHWQENLALNVKLHALLEKMYPGITRPLQLRAQRFNLDLTPGSILVEVGANGDSHKEAIVAVRALGAGIIALSQGANL